MRNSSKAPAWRRSLGWLGALVLGAGAVAEAGPPTPAPTASHSERVAGLHPGRGLEGLAHLPDDVPITLLVPRPERLFRKLEAQWARATSAQADLAHRVFLSGLAEIMGGPVAPATFQRVGIAVDREVALMLDPEAEVIILRFGLADRRRFEAWLSRTVPEERRSMELGRERAIVLYPDSDLPIICLLRVQHAHCQLGAGKDARPGAALERLLASSLRPLAEDADFVGLRSELSEDADLFAFLRPKRLASGLRRWLDERARRHQRFAAPEDQRRARELSDARAQLLRGWLEQSRLVTLGLAVDRGRLQGKAHAVLDAPAARGLAALVPAELSETDVKRWSDTPALSRLFLQLQPEAASRLFAWLGLDLPAASVDGSFAALLLGVDAECKAARSSGGDPRARLFYLPLAMAAGLRGPLAAERLILDAPAAGPPSLFSGVQFRVGADARTLHAEHLGSPLELRVLDQVVLMGTGHGAAAAAERRWTARAPRAAPGPGFLELSVDLAAVRAAISAARLEGASNQELKRLREAEQRIDLWLGDMRRLELRAHLAKDAPRLVAELHGQ